MVEALAGLAQAPITRTKAGARHVLHVPVVRRLATDRRLLEIAARFLGPTPVPFRATLFDKSRASNWLVVWHQDTALPLCARVQDPSWGPWSDKSGILYAHAPAWALGTIVALRVHLDDSTAENGPLRVLPGTHMEGVLSDHAMRQLARNVEPIDWPGVSQRQARCPYQGAPTPRIQGATRGENSCRSPSTTHGQSTAASRPPLRTPRAIVGARFLVINPRQDEGATGAVFEAASGKRCVIATAKDRAAADHVAARFRPAATIHANSRHGTAARGSFGALGDNHDSRSRNVREEPRPDGQLLHKNVWSHSR
jgi:Phytanoyl-CoA dioxygenase (PhyH)